MSKYLAEYITRAEYACRHCGKLPPGFYVKDSNEISFEYELLFRLYGDLRREYGSPIYGTSGYRCTDHQLSMYLRKESTTPYSVHVFGLAWDIRCKDEKDVKEKIKILKSLTPVPRIGWKGYLELWKKYPERYRNPWIHFDIGFLIVPLYSKKLILSKEW